MIVPAVGAQDTRITSDLPLPNQPSQKEKKKRNKKYFFSKVPFTIKTTMGPLIMLLEISKQWISML